jgi:hypothetical protein
MNYVHLLLFECLQCGEPVIVTVKSEEETNDKIIWEALDGRCKCGWLKRLLGKEARRHT